MSGEAGLVFPQPPSADWFRVKAVLDDQNDREDAPGWVVQYHWTVDEVHLERECTGGINVGPNVALAMRVARAVDSQRAFKDPTLRRDIFGKKYVSATTLIFGRNLEQDLQQLGF